jgi:tetratricopeptide (TPR) repeat protein/predicted MPP superfamily phosphohydrolase
MRLISWLHVSDIHVRPGDAWPQRVVMQALCADLEVKRLERPVDFVLVTGDLAFGGKTAEFDLVKVYLDRLAIASGVPKERIYCIPGNHDIDRDRQEFCFLGARMTLNDSSSADAFLGAPNGEDFRTLMAREAAYRSFQDSYFTGQERQTTPDGLGYIVRLAFDGIRIAIIGLDSAWLAHGGEADHMKLLLGERQILEAFDLATMNADPPHIVVAMGHHPLHLLQDFDRRAAEMRIANNCHFYHCGHLHEPEERSAGLTAQGCLTVAAGASFETRESQNTYSHVCLNLQEAKRTVTTHRYSPASGAFNYIASRTYPIEVRPVAACGMGELADALSAYGVPCNPYYLAALLLDRKAEVPVPAESGYALGSIAAMGEAGPSELQRDTAAFLAFRNVLRVLYGRAPLLGILAEHGAPVVNYATTLSALSEADASLGARLAGQESDARALAGVAPASPFSHTIDLWRDLAADQEWDQLRERAEPHVSSPDQALALAAKRMFALSLASSEELGNKQRAIELYQTLLDEDPLETSDAVNLAQLLLASGRPNEAKAVVLHALGQCPDSAVDRLRGVGHRIVEATGDREFRRQLMAAAAERGVQ